MFYNLLVPRPPLLLGGPCIFGCKRPLRQQLCITAWGAPRAPRRFFFTTNRLDVDALFIWSLPLSLVLAASFFWAAQLRGWPLPFVFVVWAAGIAIYIFVIAHCVRPLVSPKSMGNCHRPSYDDTRAMRRYDWHNCNPIKASRSVCAPSCSG